MAREVDLRTGAEADRKPIVVDDRPVVSRQRGAKATAWWVVLTLVNASFAIIAAVVPLRRILADGDVNTWWNYTANEWLINYGDGAVRRGLGGEILRRLPLDSDRTAVTVVVAGLAVLVPLLFAVLVQLVIRSRRTGWPLLLWGIPGGFLLGTWQIAWLPISDTQVLFATRKEYAFAAVLLALAIALRLTARVMLLAVIFGLAMGAGALVHEALVLPFAVAGSALVIFAQRNGLRLRTLAAIWLPVIAAVLVAIALPDPDSTSIQRQWSALDEQTRSWLGGEIGWPMRWLGLDLPYAVKATAATMANRDMLLPWLALCLFSVGWTLAALRLVDTSGRAFRASLAVGAGVTVAVLPLVALGIDWGRFAVVVATCTAIACLGRQLHDPPESRAAGNGTGPIVLAAVLVGLLALIGVPEAGPPLGGLRGDAPASD